VSELAVRVVDGTPILGLEPSCALTLVDEWPELFPGEETKRVAAAVHLADAWIGEQLTSKSIKVSWQPLPGKCLFHGHCHQRALVGVNGSATALRQVPGLDVDVLDAGCCGMAGAFGYEADHFDLSVRIAGLALLPAIEKEKEAIVVAMGTSCRHQIRDLSGCEAFHPIELIRKALPSP
jgi:Fe-S oxidoreductase